MSVHAFAVFGFQSVLSFTWILILSCVSHSIQGNALKDAGQVDGAISCYEVIP